jgi:hypothetical protein
MPYHISSSDSNKIIFERDSTKVISSVFIGIGILMTFIDILTNALMTSWEFPNNMLRLFFPAFGILFTLAGVTFQNKKENPPPKQSHSTIRKVRLSFKWPKEKVTWRTFHILILKALIIRREVRSSGKHSSTYYSTFIKKKHGGQWFVSESGSLNSQKELANKLRTEVPLNNPLVR